MTADDRETALTNFRSGAINVAVSTDLLARSVDFQSVSIHFIKSGVEWGGERGEERGEGREKEGLRTYS
jgi:superfamily II DNA or RNA helicase